MVLDELAYLTGELQAAASAGAWATAAVTPAASVPVTATASVRRARRGRGGGVIVDVLRGGGQVRGGHRRSPPWVGLWSGAVDDMGGGEGDVVVIAFPDPRGEHEQHGDHHEGDARDAEPVEGHGGDERVAVDRGRPVHGDGAVDP